MRRKEIEETLSAVANRLYRIGDSESSHHSTTTSTETVGEEIQRLSFLIDKCVAALKTKEGDSQQTTNSRYVTALDVFEEWKELFDTCEGDKAGFFNWLTERLNAAK